MSFFTLNSLSHHGFNDCSLKIKNFQYKALHAGINAALTGNYLTTVGSNIDEDIRDFTNAGFTIDNKLSLVEDTQRRTR